VGSTKGGFRAGDVGKLDRVITTGELMLDVKNFLVRVGGEPLELRLKEFELLAALAWHPWELRSRQELAAEIWGYAGATSSRTIDMHVRRLRAALAEKSSHDYVRTVKGFGYRFVPSNGPGNPDR
jgi:DNA-binding response OmpR family regulator